MGRSLSQGDGMGWLSKSQATHMIGKSIARTPEPQCQLIRFLSSHVTRREKGGEVAKSGAARARESEVKPVTIIADTILASPPCEL